MQVDVITLFPSIVTGALGDSIMHRAQQAGHLDLRVHNLRDYTTDKHRITDEPPYGGGPGMVMKCEPIFHAVETLAGPDLPSIPRILLCPQGRPLTHHIARELAQHPRLILLCGHYEGIDERVREHLITDEISIGDYVISNGALAAAVLIDSIARLIPGVLGHADSATDESFTHGLLEYPQYTRPADFRGWKIPDILTSGHHGHIAQWRKEQSLLRTQQKRPELLQKPQPEA